MTQIDSRSLVTEVVLNTSVPTSNFQLFTFQLSAFPNATSLPKGESLLIIQFNLDQAIESIVTQAVIALKVPQSTISLSSVDSNSIVIQRYSPNGWTTLNIKVTGSDSEYVFLEASSPGLSLFAVTGSASSGFPIVYVGSIVSVVLLIVGVGVVVERRRARARW